MNENKLLISNSKYEIYNFISSLLVNHNFKYYELNNTTYIKVKISNVYIEFTPYSSAVDKTIIMECIYPFCSSLNQMFYQKELNKKIIVIYNFESLHIQYQLCIYHIIKKCNKFCTFILISNTIDNISTFILNIVKVEKLFLDDSKIDKKWIQIYKKYEITPIDNWKKMIDFIFESLLKKQTNINFILENRKYISILFITNIEIEDIFIYFFEKFVNLVQEEEHLFFITELFTKYQFSITQSTRYIIHFEALLMNLYYYLHFPEQKFV